MEIAKARKILKDDLKEKFSDKEIEELIQLLEDWTQVFFKNKSNNTKRNEK